MVAILSSMLSLCRGWMLSFDYCYLIGNMPESRRLILKSGFLVSFGFSSHVVGSICAGNESVVIRCCDKKLWSNVNANNMPSMSAFAAISSKI